MQAENSYRVFYFKKEKHLEDQEPNLESWFNTIKNQIKGSDSEFKQKLLFPVHLKFWKVEIMQQQKK